MDLKPQNIMLHFPDIVAPINTPEELYSFDVSERCQVKLIDMGYIVQLDKTNGQPNQLATLNSIKGTHGYHAPEIIKQYYDGDYDDPFYYT